MLSWVKMAVVALVVVVLGSVLLAKEATNTSNVYGTITQLGTGTITLHTPHWDKTVKVGDATLYKVEGKEAKFEDLKLGMNAIAFGKEGEVATEIRAYTPKAKPPVPTQPAKPHPEGITGIIESMAKDAITIKAKDHTLTIPVNASTEVKIMGKEAKLEDLKPGMYAYVIGPAGQPAKEIRAYPPKTNTK